jgi:UDP-N-acetylmuramate--alanine ligase
MSALAYVLIKRGYHVSGSDAKPGYMAPSWPRKGPLVFIGHAACQIERAEVVVISTAIHPDNPELVEAKRRQVPVIHRSDVLAYLMNKHKGHCCSRGPRQDHHQLHAQLHHL